jgi:hypothetical protein
VIIIKIGKACRKNAEKSITKVSTTIKLLAKETDAVAERDGENQFVGQNWWNTLYKHKIVQLQEEEEIIHYSHEKLKNPKQSGIEYVSAILILLDFGH